MNAPIVSVVMSVLNGERFLQEAVESILNQTFDQFEFIIINDGSSDNTPSILDSYRVRDSRVQVYHQENRGLVESLNRGCRLATGKYIARMDADDVAVRERLMWQVEFMEKHEETGAVGGAFEVIDGSGASILTYRTPVGDREIKLALTRFCALLHPTVLMRRDVFFAVGQYRKVVVDAEDYDLFLRIAEHCQLANLDRVVLRYRLHPSQVCVRKCRQNSLSGLAAQVAAKARRNGSRDPLETLDQVTPESLAELGVSHAAQEAAVARDYLRCIHNMYSARESSIGAVIDLVRSFDLTYADSSVRADLHMFAAQLYWRQRKIARSILSAGRALVARPKIAARPLKPWLSRLNAVES